jgi:hypothetical protein
MSIERIDSSESELSLPTDSDIESERSKEEIEQMVLEEPMYHVLNQFLMTDDGKNITNILEELVIELREIRKKLT